MAAFFAEDCEISAVAPFIPREARRGTDAVRDFVTEALGNTIVVDLTRKQMSGDKVRWRVRTPSSDPEHAATGGYRVGQAEATFDKGKISTFSLGPRP